MELDARFSNTQFWSHNRELANGSLRSTQQFQIYLTICVAFSDFTRIIILSGRHRNKYCLNLEEFNFILHPYRSSLSYIKGRSDFQAKVRKRAKEEYGCWQKQYYNMIELCSYLYGAFDCTVLQYFTLMLSYRRGHSFDVSSNTSADFSYRCLIMNFSFCSGQCFKLFLKLW